MPGAALVVCADDYGLSEPTSRAIRMLAEAGALNATTCLVETQAWPQAVPALRDLQRQRPGFAAGLHLNLTELFPHCARPDTVKPTSWWLTWSVRAPHDPIRARALAAFEHQWELFTEAMGHAPAFLDGHQYVHLFGPARAALLDLVNAKEFKGWIRQCRTSSRRWDSQRLVFDGLSDRLARSAAAAGVHVNPGFGGLRWFRLREDIARIWRTDCAGMREGGVLVVHPGAAGSPRGSDGIDSARIQEAQILTSGALDRILADLGQRLTADAHHPTWVRTGP